MKKRIVKKLIVGLLLLLILPLSANAQQTKKVHLSGSVTGFAKLPKVVCEFVSDAPEDVLKLSDKGTFSADYDLSEEIKAYLHVLADDVDKTFSILFRPGQSLVVDVTNSASGVNAVFSGDTGSFSAYLDLNRNSIMSDAFSEEQWQKLPNFESFKEYLTTQQMPVFDCLSQVPDSDFVDSERRDIIDQSLDYAFSFATTKEKSGYKMENDAAFMTLVKDIDLNDTLQLHATASYLGWYIVAHPQWNDVMEPVARLRCAKTLIKNQDVLNKLADNSLTLAVILGMYGGDDTSIPYAIYKEFLAVSTDPKGRQVVTDLCQAIDNQRQGANPPELTLLDEKGGAHTLKEVVNNGKYTYIDFWATWCVPCRKEIPFLKELVKQHKNNKNVCFVSISLDENQAAWRKNLSTEKPEWQQYIIPKDEQEAFSVFYSMSGIPRFMMFDKKGLMMNANASRPSDEKTVKLLKQLANETK